MTRGTCVSRVYAYYPNPTADRIHISGMQEGQQVRLFTSDGRLTVVGTSSDIDLSGMSSGVYLLQVGKEVVKVIKK
ncbi:MAG: T9SS type A sorting domain-containing protein [Bacteroidales bacterium]|nr:T9SS type A sorting domain-containing protein [Bacteroidales bacterium]